MKSVWQKIIIFLKDKSIGVKICKMVTLLTLSYLLMSTNMIKKPGLYLVINCFILFAICFLAITSLSGLKKFTFIFFGPKNIYLLQQRQKY